MSTITVQINELINQLIKNFKSDFYDKNIDNEEIIFLRKKCIDGFNTIYNNFNLCTDIIHNIEQLTINDLIIGKTHYTKKENQTLNEFKENELHLRIAAENRAKNKNMIDDIMDRLTFVYKSSSDNIHYRLTNLDCLSACIDRLITERIKEYNFKLDNRINEQEHQNMLCNHINNLIDIIIKESVINGYYYIGEKRTFDEAVLIKILQNAQ